MEKEVFVKLDSYNEALGLVDTMKIKLDKAKVTLEKVKKLKESEEVLKRNYMLMQLDEVDISASAKTKILDKIREPINRLNKMQFQKRFIEDRLFATLPNMESWLVQCFAKLNQMAEKTHGKKEKV